MVNMAKCAFGCYMKGISSFKFPDPRKHPARFRQWVELVGDRFKDKGDDHIHRERRVCYRHFEEKDLVGIPGVRLALKKDAVPVNHLAGIPVPPISMRRQKKRTPVKKPSPYLSKSPKRMSGTPKIRLSESAVIGLPKIRKPKFCLNNSAPELDESAAKKPRFSADRENLQNGSSCHNDTNVSHFEKSNSLYDVSSFEEFNGSVGVPYAKSKMLQILSAMDEQGLGEIEHWISSSLYKNDLKRLTSLQSQSKQLSEMAEAIKAVAADCSQLPTERIRCPEAGRFRNCGPNNTCTVDKFLEPENKDGALMKYKCKDCDSTDIEKLTVISHSLPRVSLMYIFKVLLPADLSGKHLVDLGSRLGGVLYAAYHLSNAETITGIEMHKKLVEIQEDVIHSYRMDTDRIKVVHSNIMDQPGIVSHSDIFIANVFDFFLEPGEQIKLWEFLKAHIRAGSYIVTYRSIEETLNTIGVCDEFVDWVSICQPNQPENEILFDIQTFDYSDLFIYRVN